jgi:hypothetical protein
MGNCVATVVSGVRIADATGPGSVEEYLLTIVPGSASTDYATNGQPFVMPSDIKGAQFDSLQVLSRTPLTRQWSWNGSQSAPKLVAEDAFATEEGNGTTVNTDSLTCLLRVRR